MNLANYLEITGPATAAFLAQQTGRSHEDIYGELVREEAQGRVEIIIDGEHIRRWAAVSNGETTCRQ